MRPDAKDRMEIIWDTLPDALLIIACGEGCRYFGAMQGHPWVEWVERWPA